MDFGNFLGQLDESKSFKKISGKQLREAAGESATDITSDNKWFYVPTKEYNGARHIIKEEGPNAWVVYYLENIGVAGGGAADTSGIGDMSAFLGAKRAGIDAHEAKDLSKLAGYLSEANGETNGVNLEGLVVVRKVAGDFATVLKECVGIVKQG